MQGDKKGFAMNTRGRIREYITTRFPGVANRTLSDDESLLDSGIIDSLGILDLVTFLESEFHVIVKDDELDTEHFRSIASLAGLVDRKVNTDRDSRKS